MNLCQFCEWHSLVENFQQIFKCTFSGHLSSGDQMFARLSFTRNAHFRIIPQNYALINMRQLSCVWWRSGKLCNFRLCHWTNSPHFPSSSSRSLKNCFIINVFPNGKLSEVLYFVLQTKEIHLKNKINFVSWRLHVFCI